MKAMPQEESFSDTGIADRTHAENRQAAVTVSLAFLFLCLMGLRACLACDHSTGLITCIGLLSQTQNKKWGVHGEWGLGPKEGG